MNSARTAWAIFWLVVLLLAFVFQAYSAWKQPYFRLADLIGLFGLAILTYKHLIANFEHLHLLVEKGKLWLFNRTTEWSLEVNLVIDADDDDAAVVSSTLESLLFKDYAGQISVERRTPTDFHFRLDRQLAAVARTYDDDDTVCINLSILDMAVSYRDSIYRIDHHVCPLFRKIEDQFHARPEGRKYCLSAYFREGNPYFGVFIQKLKVSMVDTFNLTINTDKKESVLSIKRDRVELTARSLDTFKTESANTFRLGIGAK